MVDDRGAVLDAARATGLTATALTFDPHPRAVVGDGVELLSTLERRLELHERAVRIREQVFNPGGVDRPIGWTQHAGFLGPLSRLVEPAVWADGAVSRTTWSVTSLA